MNTMHLFAGGGGGMYADLILGHKTVVAVEQDRSCCDVLRTRKEEGWFPDLEIIEGDVREFDASGYKGRVDCVAAGFPCQDVSLAGGRAGLDGDRSSLYLEAIRCVREAKPRYVWLENVSAITSAGVGRVHRDLAEAGFYRQRWACISSAEAGASMPRERWWCFAQISADFEGKPVEEPQVVQQADKRPPWELRRVAGHISKDIRTSCWETYQHPMDGTAYEVPNWCDRIKMLGNSQDPEACAFAWVMLGGPTNLGGT